MKFQPNLLCLQVISFSSLSLVFNPTDSFSFAFQWLCKEWLVTWLPHSANCLSVVDHHLYKNISSLCNFHFHSSFISNKKETNLNYFSPANNCPFECFSDAGQFFFTPTKKNQFYEVYQMVHLSLLVPSPTPMQRNATVQAFQLQHQGTPLVQMRFILLL